MDGKEGMEGVSGTGVGWVGRKRCGVEAWRSREEGMILVRDDEEFVRTE